MPVDSAVHKEGRLITEDYPVPKIIIFQALCIPQHKMPSVVWWAPS
jgi:hypothetical protein